MLLCSYTSTNTYVDQMLQTFNNYTRHMKHNTAFPGCSLAKIARIGSGVAAQMHGEDSLLVGIICTRTLMLEVVASCDLWFCHAFFSVAGSKNDINVVDQSLLVDDVLKWNRAIHFF
jgi:hypothetical protein